jgi:hypothetical protein
MYHRFVVERLSFRDEFVIGDIDGVGGTPFYGTPDTLDEAVGKIEKTIQAQIDAFTRIGILVTVHSI